MAKKRLDAFVFLPQKDTGKVARSVVFCRIQKSSLSHSRRCFVTLSFYFSLSFVPKFTMGGIALVWKNSRMLRIGQLDE